MNAKIYVCSDGTYVTSGKLSVSSLSTGFNNITTNTYINYYPIHTEGTFIIQNNDVINYPGSIEQLKAELL